MKSSRLSSITRRSWIRGAGLLAVVTPAVGLAGRWMGGCDGSPGAGDIDQNQVLRGLAGDVVMPTLVSFEENAIALAAALEAMASEATIENLAAARTAWSDARGRWKQSLAFAFGPTKDIGPAIDWWPADPAGIEEAIAGGTVASGTDVDTLGTNKKGLMALEYLLFDPAATDEEMAAQLVGPRAAFASALAANLAARATELRAAWDPAAGGYADAFGEAGVSSEIYKSPKDAVDALVNELVFLTDSTANDGIAKPLGLKSGGVIAPELEEAARSNRSLLDIRDRVQSIDNAWEGRFGEGDGQGVAALVEVRSAALVSEVRAAIDAVYTALDAVPGTLGSALIEAPATLQAVFDSLIELKRVFGSDVVSVLGVTLTFNDNDGD